MNLVQVVFYRNDKSFVAGALHRRWVVVNKTYPNRCQIPGFQATYASRSIVTLISITFVVDRACTIASELEKTSLSSWLLRTWGHFLCRIRDLTITPTTGAIITLIIITLIVRAFKIASELESLILLHYYRLTTAERPKSWEIWTAK